MLDEKHKGPIYNEYQFKRIYTHIHTHTYIPVLHMYVKYEEIHQTFHVLFLHVRVIQLEK